MRVVTSVLITASLLGACGDGSTDATIDDVDEFLAEICELAEACPGISSTQQEVDACPLEVRSELSQAQLTELERFTTYTDDRQDCILACIGGAICGRFGGSVSNLSDSDVVEPFRGCEQQCM
jgi:hypothetical protein